MRRLLDLFCCAGGASEGYRRAGFEVVGVDIDPQPNYPGEFIKADALEVLADLDFMATFDAVAASPPCQVNLNLTKMNVALGREHGHVQLIPATRAGILATGLPYVIENVADARSQLRNPIRLCGSTFGLPVRRHRLFESSEPLVAPPCNHRWQKVPRYWTSWRPNGEHRLASVVQVYGHGADQHEWGPALGIDWMTGKELAEAIPPAYTEFLGRQLLRFVELREHQAVAA